MTEEGTVKRGDIGPTKKSRSGTYPRGLTGLTGLILLVVRITWVCMCAHVVHN